MATPSVQPLNNFGQKGLFRASTSHPDLANPQLVDSLIRHKLDESDQTIQTLRHDLRSEKDRNRILEAQVNSLEAVIAQLLNQAEQYHYEALVNEKRVKDLESKLEKEVSKRHAHVKTAQKLENAVDRVKSLEKQLKVQVDIRANESMSDDQLAWSVVENSALRAKVDSLQKDLAHERHQQRFNPADSFFADEPLTAEIASSVAELALIKDRLALDLKLAPSSSSPSEDYAACVVENFALKDQLENLVGQRAIKDVADIQSEIQLEAVHEQMEQLKTLEEQFDKLSAACTELEVRRSSVVTESAKLVSAHFEGSTDFPDEQLAYALVENRIMKEKYGISQ